MDFRKIGIASAVGLGLVLLSFSWGFLRGRRHADTIIIDKIVYKEGQTKVEYRDKIVTVTKVIKPDGTITETTKTEDKQGTKETKSSQVAQVRSTEIKPILPNYSLGLHTAIDWNGLLDKPTYGVVGGYRILGPVWLEAGTVPQKELITLGLRIEL